MAHPTRPQLLDLVEETKYDGRAIERMMRLYDILQTIAQDGFLRERLALRGGTALNAFHFDLDRLSVDIDLDYIDPLAEDVARGERAVVDGMLTRILRTQGYRLKEELPGRSGSKWVAGFDSALGGGSILKIDLGYIDLQPLFGVSRMSSAELGGRSATGMLVLDIEDVIAGKLAALFQRTHIRDLFDAMSIMEREKGLDMENIRTAFLVSVVSSAKGWRDPGIDTRGANIHNACQKLMTCLPQNYFRNLYPGCSSNSDAAAAWFNESIAVCRERFGDLLALTPGERMFVDGVQDRGEINVDLLSAPAELRAGIAAWPRLAWKCRSVRP